MVSFFIPKKINVGFQKRSDTYTEHLAYIIYYDEKGKLRKEKSWDGWRNKEIDNQIHDNEPISGFVLNKKAGGYSTGWSHRQTYVRVYDPRGFEFEITISNLLYILENATSTKGKGLEGDFVYGWDGKDLVLIPTDAPDYKELVELNALRHAKEFIKTKELILGATYRTKGNEELIYVGRFDEHDYYGKAKKRPQFYFYTKNNYFTTKASISQQLVEVISKEPVDNYAEIMDKLEKNTKYSPIDESKAVYTPYTLEEFTQKLTEKSYGNIYIFKGDTKERTNVSKSYHEETYYFRRELPNTVSTWGRNYYNYEDVKGSPEELFNILKPMSKRQYLANGKFYGEVSY